MSKKLRFQLPIIFRFNIFAVQPNHLTGSITFRLSSFIMVSFLLFLGVLYFFSLCSYKIPKFFGQLISCFRLGEEVDVLFVGNTQVVPKIKLERHVPRAGVFRIIISKFHYAQEPCSVILFVINKDSKVSFHGTILLLNLAVGLEVEGGREPLFDAQEEVQGGPKLRCEY